ncbi:MAG: dual specificity protein phosphatase family protein [Nodosilinea sp.]
MGDTAPSTALSESLWWVIPNRLGGLRKPTPGEISTLTALGVDAIVSVMDDPTNLDLYEQANMPHLWLPTTGGTAPTPEQIGQFTQFVDGQNAQAKSVGVHCSTGRRRTGTFLAAYLIATGQSAETAIAAITRANPLVELREAQIGFLHDLYALGLG